MAQHISIRVPWKDNEHFGLIAELKRTDPMEWVRLMNMAHSICEEFIFDRIVYK